MTEAMREALERTRPVVATLIRCGAVDEVGRFALEAPRRDGCRGDSPRGSRFHGRLTLADVFPPDPMSVLFRQLVRAESDRRFHIARQHKGNLEAMLAGHKAAWLRDLIREIGTADDVRRAEEIRRGG